MLSTESCAEVSLRQFGTSAELSQHFWKGPKCLWDTSALVPNCLGSEMSRVGSVRRANSSVLLQTYLKYLNNVAEAASSATRFIL